MGWGVSRRPKISNRLGGPVPREGSDGDIQVRQTGLGARLFAKLGGRWFSNVLYGSEIDDPDVFIPKCWSTIVTLPGSTAATTLTYSPDYITNENILGATITIFGANFAIFGMSLDNALGIFASYNNMFYFDAAGTKAIKCANTGSTWQGKETRITIFFK